MFTLQIMLNSKSMAAIRYLKSTNSSLENTTMQQLASMTGCERKYFIRHKHELETYYKNSPDATPEEVRYFHNKSLEYFLTLHNDKDGKYFFKDDLGAITGHLLKYKYNLLGHLKTNTKVIEIGKAVIAIMCDIKSRKNLKEGASINSKSKKAKFLLEGNKVAFIDKLFTRSNDYKVGSKSKKWKITALGEELLKDVVEFFIENIEMICNKKTKRLPFPVIKKWYHSAATYSSVSVPFRVPITTDKNLIVALNHLATLSLSSILQLLNACVHYDKFKYELHISLAHMSSTDETLGRCYNVFTRLHSCERKIFGYVNYDMSCALQTISLQLINANKDSYPMLTRYASDKSYKRLVRETIAHDLEVSVSTVKQRLTAFANGGISGANKHLLYGKFQNESDNLRREVLCYVAKYEPKILKLAIEQSKKRKLLENINWLDSSPEESQTLARNKSSVFFFVWTYYERIIRQAMLLTLTDGIEVHDAVYSKMNLEVKVIEDKILDETGFHIVIEKD